MKILGVALLLLASWAADLKPSAVGFLQTDDEELEDRTSEAQPYVDNLINIVLTTSDDGVEDGVFYKTTEDIEKNIEAMEGIDLVIDEDSYFDTFGKKNTQSDLDFGIVTNEAALAHMEEADLVIKIEYGEAEYIPEDEYYAEEEVV